MRVADTARTDQELLVERARRDRLGYKRRVGRSPALAGPRAWWVATATTDMEDFTACFVAANEDYAACSVADKVSKAGVLFPISRRRGALDPRRPLRGGTATPDRRACTSKHG